MNAPSARTEQVYVTRATRNMLETLAQLHTAEQPEGTEGPSISMLADGLADSILRDALDAVPGLREQQREIGKSVREIKARFAQPKP